MRSLHPKSILEEKKDLHGNLVLILGDGRSRAIEGIIKELHPGLGGRTHPEVLVDMLSESYERCLFVDSGVGRTEHRIKKSEEVAEYPAWRHLNGTCGLVEIGRGCISKREGAGRFPGIITPAG